MGTLLLEITRGLFGITVLIGFCWLLSEKRKAVDWRLVITGVVMQFILAALILKVPFVSSAIGLVSKFFVKVLAFSHDGAQFVFGPNLVDNSFGAVIAFQVLPSIIFFSALSAMLYHIGLLQIIVYGIAWIMKRTMRLSGAESLASAANIFVGQTEAPLIVRPYISGMTRSEIMCLMTGGMATIAGGVLVAYIAMLGGDSIEQREIFGKHLLTASLLSAPAAVLIAKILIPQTEAARDEMRINKETISTNIFEAATEGTTQGLKLAFNVGAVLLVFTALISMGNYVTEEWIGEWFGLNAWVTDLTAGEFKGFTLQFVFAMLFAPVAWLIGIDNQNLLLVGQLLGEKTVLNEFIAYASLGEMIQTKEITNANSIVIVTYALCGFANFASMGIQIGGIGTIAPDQRPTLAKLALRSLIGGTVACLMTGAIAGIFLV
ncbi:NupC/NupG family nucleoside CNT transporter [Rubellicoccus peritrichatus]|uniref:Nucleoside transporter C-terminal domain-containing protein n=1 Tax=Rubellicoccus peritrichatus TaxID=3080537 RepID=A0AAQ3QUM9_9BACT|nr:nucleoside transporter C-terminal domain-containing protein [Puniceicoccus sp. CR14]WOO42541.1 nucleoside transporter C-terminal domain-containing protein [Puniceicoccus sp. CR14]